jgi:hypothetical protein
MNTNMKALKLAATYGLSSGALFAAFSLIFHFGEWHRLLLVFGIGIFVGLVGAPEIEPKVFKNAWKLQLISGITAGILIALVFNLSTDAIAVSALLGGLIGWSAPFWVKHVPIP